MMTGGKFILRYIVSLSFYHNFVCSIAKSYAIFQKNLKQAKYKKKGLSNLEEMQRRARSHLRMASLQRRARFQKM